MIRDFNTIKKFRFWCQKVLPTVYDDSLSYYEVLCKLRDFVNNLATNIANIYEEIYTDLKDYVAEWMEEHPDVTTTVQDNAITRAKINSEVELSDTEIDNIFDGSTVATPLGYASANSLQQFREDIKKDIDILQGKTMIVFGDSIARGANASGNGWAEQIASEHGMTLINYAEDGATLCNMSSQGREWVGDQVDVAVSDADYVVISAGTNDVGWNSEFGRVAQGSSVVSLVSTTFTGGLETIIQHVYQKYPGSKILFVTPHRAANHPYKLNDLGLCGMDYFNRVNELCKRYSVPVVDLYNTCNLVTWFGESYMQYTDSYGLHPTAEGYRIFYVPIIEKALIHCTPHASDSNTPVLDITDTFLTPDTGFSVQSNMSAVYKEGSHVYGKVQVVSTNGVNKNGINCGTLKYPPLRQHMTYCKASTGTWNLDNIIVRNVFFTNDSKITLYGDANATLTIFVFDVDYQTY